MAHPHIWECVEAVAYELLKKSDLGGEEVKDIIFRISEEGNCPITGSITLRNLKDRCFKRNKGFIKKRVQGVLELGEFFQDKKGRIFPMWYRDINNPEHILLLFPPKNTLSNNKKEHF